MPIVIAIAKPQTIFCPTNKKIRSDFHHIDISCKSPDNQFYWEFFCVFFTPLPWAGKWKISFFSFVFIFWTLSVLIHEGFCNMLLNMFFDKLVLANDILSIISGGFVHDRGKYGPFGLLQYFMGLLLCKITHKKWNE